jgi:hypothetical protein
MRKLALAFALACILGATGAQFAHADRAGNPCGFASHFDKKTGGCVANGK